jgi:hypothetical protein
LFIINYILGQNSAEQKALSNFIFSLITMAIYPPVPTSQKAKSLMSRLPGSFLQLFSDIRLRIWEFAQIEDNSDAKGFCLIQGRGVSKIGVKKVP